MAFNPLEHPIIFSLPERDTPSPWTQHVPFGMLLVDVARPRQIVDLGTDRGIAFCAFCQAVKTLDLDCRCYGVDTWDGDVGAGCAGQEVLDDLRAHQTARYESFSTLIQSRFDDAVQLFADGSIDLLHIDSLHTSQAAQHAFDTWLPKMSSRGVVLLHGIAEDGASGGVGKLWTQLTADYPRHLELLHGHGLGLVVVGETVPDGLQQVLDVPKEQWSALLALFRELGMHIECWQETRGLRTLASTSPMKAEPSLQAAPEAPELEREELHQSEAAERQALVAHYEQQLKEQQELAAGEKRRAREAARQRALETEQRIALASAEQRRALEAEHRRYEAILTEERRRLNDALWELSVLGASRGVRFIKLLRAAHAAWRQDGSLALAKQATLWMVGRRGLALPESAAAQSEPTVVLAPTLAAPGRKAVMYISLQADNSMRYRCEHQAEALGYVGCTSDVGIYGRTSLGDVADRYACFVLHRIPYAPDVASFIDAVHRQGKSVFFDTDDWIFDTEVARYVPAYQEMDGNRQALFRRDLTRIQQTMRACDGVIVSTDSLRTLALRHNSHVMVVPNAVSHAMIHGADAALEKTTSARHLARRDTVTIGYFSGTPTHNGDFPEAADALLWALEQYPEAVFKVVGLLKLDKRFEQFGPRVVRIDLQPWQELPQIYTTIDVNIAPLERESPFTDAKSCVKYLEAALCEVPTIASPRTDFRRVIVHGENGLFADTPDEWKAALRQLIESAQLRREMGLRASQRVRAEETTLARSSTVQATLRALASASDPDADTQPLRVNWVLDAHSGEPDGGYHIMFRLANHLGRQGHVVRVYLLPVDQLADMSRDEIQAYVSEHFGPLAVELCIGHERILPADVTIATSWTTANVVEQHRDSLHKAYLIQDFEPDSYNPGDPTYVEAERTYELALKHICIGASLGRRIQEISARKSEVIDVAIDQTIFQMRRAPEDRKGPVQVLFFVRPGMKRQEYELGIEALNRVKVQRPDVNILLFGSSDAELGHLPFAESNLGVLRQSELADVLNRVHILLTVSPSETSWVPFAGMACGVAVVEADMESVGGIVPTDASWVRAHPDGESLEAAVLRLVEDDALRAQVAKSGAQFVSQRTWEHTARQLEDALVAGCWPRERRQVVTSQHPLRVDTPTISK